MLADFSVARDLRCSPSHCSSLRSLSLDEAVQHRCCPSLLAFPAHLLASLDSVARVLFRSVGATRGGRLRRRFWLIHLLSWFPRAPASGRSGRWTRRLRHRQRGGLGIFASALPLSRAASRKSLCSVSVTPALWSGQGCWSATSAGHHVGLAPPVPEGSGSTCRRIQKTLHTLRSLPLSSRSLLAATFVAPSQGSRSGFGGFVPASSAGPDHRSVPVAR